MSMNKNFDNAYLNNHADSVIKRGYEIYDEWVAYGFSSRKIVSCTERAVAAVEAKRTYSSCTVALSYLFALDMRIREKYNTLLRCIFLYFSWRRETKALRRLKVSFNIKEGKDIRNAIEIEFEKLFEKLDQEYFDDGDDETRGGKRNGKSEEEAVAAEEKGKEQDFKENSEKITDSEKTEKASEEKTEDVFEQTSEDEQITEKGENQQNVESFQEKSEPALQEKIEEIREEKIELKAENKESHEKSESSIDKSNEVRSHNDAVDSPPIYDNANESKPVADENKISFTDEFIRDDMVKENVSVHDRQDDFKVEDAQRTEDSIARGVDNDKSAENDAYSYDKAMPTENEDSLQNTEVTSQEKTEIKQGAEQKTEIKQDAVQNNENTASFEKEVEDVRVPLQVDINESQENDMRKELADSMSLEVIEAIINAQKEAAREQMYIAELEADDPGVIIGKQDPVQVSPPSIAHRK